MDPDVISETLAALSTPTDAYNRRKHVSTLRGVRGVVDGELARVIAAAWHEQRPSLPDDGYHLQHLFSTSFEDGLVAIGLLAAAAPDHPHEALDIGLDWLEFLDDVVTADALGWYVLGPAALAADAADQVLERTVQHSKEEARRAGVMAALAMVPARVEGPAAAAVRERLGTRHVRFVEEPLSPVVTRWADAFLRDESPAVRKAVRRLVREWGKADPEAVVAWADAVSGGFPGLIHDEVERARRRAERQQS